MFSSHSNTPRPSCLPLKKRAVTKTFGEDNNNNSSSPPKPSDQSYLVLWDRLQKHSKEIVQSASRLCGIYRQKNENQIVENESVLLKTVFKNLDELLLLVKRLNTVYFIDCGLDQDISILQQILHEKLMGEERETKRRKLHTTNNKNNINNSHNINNNNLDNNHNNNVNTNGATNHNKFKTPKKGNTTRSRKVKDQKRETKRGRKPSDKSNRICYHCSTTKTPEWRRGPAGSNTLCNACGLKYAKSIRRSKEKKEKQTSLSFILND